MCAKLKFSHYSKLWNISCLIVLSIWLHENNILFQLLFTEMENNTVKSNIYLVPFNSNSHSFENYEI